MTPTQGGIPVATAGSSPAAVRARRVEIANVYLSKTGPAAGQNQFLFSGQGRATPHIYVNSLIGVPAKVRLQCDGAAQLLGIREQPEFIHPGGRRSFMLAPHSHGQVIIAVGAGVQVCTLDWGSGRQLVLRRSAQARPDLARIETRHHTCTPPAPERMSPLEAAFFAQGGLNQTCARPVAGLRLLDRPLVALNARIEALTGRRVSEALLLRGDPEMALDFSNAPRLRMVFISYLLVRADYSGALLRRMLEWHAQRGTIVRILVSRLMILRQDRAMLEAMAARYPNITLQYYAWSRAGFPTPSAVLNRLHRVHHIKLFATLAENPARSRAIVGGRNFWDGYFFDAPFDLSAFPDLRTYEADSNHGMLYHSVYRDFEVEIGGGPAVADIVAQLSEFWQRDERSQTMERFSVNGPPRGAVPEGVMRHFVSLPWADGKALEAYYVTLIDAARREIVLVTPFFYPPPDIAEALERARARGVKVTLVSRRNSNDQMGAIVAALNTISMEEIGQGMEIFRYTSDVDELHTKLVLIDDRLAMVVSVNLNRRSFSHDGENGMVFLDHAMVGRLKRTIDAYLAASSRFHPGAGEQKLPLERIMANLRTVWEYF